MPDITGQLVEAGAGPLNAWRVEVQWVDLSAGAGWAHEVSGDSNAAGDFVLSVPVVKVLLNGTSSLYRVRVKTHVGRTVWESAHFPLFPLPGTHPLGTITIPTGNLRGWLVTNLAPAGAPSRLSTNNAVFLHVDNVAAWDALRAAVVASNQEINLGLFYFDVPYVFLSLPDPPPPHVPTIGTRLEDELLTANRTRGATVRLLIRDVALLPYPFDTADTVISYFAAVTPPHTVNVRRYTTSGSLPMHAKYVVCDGIDAHILGSPLLQEYFDGPEHKIDEARRGALGPPSISISLRGVELPKNSIRVPVHDVGVQLQGDAVDHMQQTFFLHWNNAGSPDSSPLHSVVPAGPHHAVQIARSLPGATFTGLPTGETGILEAYLRCFAEATDYVYLENQYLTEYIIYEAIRLALKASAVQFILLINNKVDIPGYQGWQRQRINALKQNLADDGTVDRFGVFTLWGHDDGVSPNRLIMNYVHSKVAIADDHWATIGSANLDGVSLMTGEYANLGILPFMVGDEDRRATEVNAIVYNGVSGQPASDVPRSLRQILWAEHLGLAGPADPVLATRPAGGWLSLWKGRADAKKASLMPTGTTSEPARILEWTGEANPEAALRALGIDPRRFNVLGEFPSFDFGTGEWRR